MKDYDVDEKVIEDWLFEQLGKINIYNLQNLKKWFDNEGSIKHKFVDEVKIG